MISIKDLKPEIKRIFVEEGLGAALMSLKAALPENSKAYSEVILLEADLKGANKKKMRGSISQSELDVKYNSLRERFMDFLDSLEEKDLEAPCSDKKSNSVDPVLLPSKEKEIPVDHGHSVLSVNPSKIPLAISWNRLKVPLLIAAVIFVGAIEVWQLWPSSGVQGIWVCEEHFNQCQKEDGYYLVKKDTLWGYVDDEGTVMIDPRFQEIHPFDSSGLALVKENGKYGWVDRNGYEEISFQYDFATVFKEGKAKVVKGEDSFFIDLNGDRIEEDSGGTNSSLEVGHKEKTPVDSLEEEGEVPPKPVKGTDSLIQQASRNQDTASSLPNFKEEFFSWIVHVNETQVSGSFSFEGKKYQATSNSLSFLEFWVPKHLEDSLVLLKVEKPDCGQSKTKRVKINRGKPFNFNLDCEHNN